MRPIEVPVLCFVTDRKRCRGRDLEEVVNQAVEHGARMVQLREKDLSSSDLHDLGKRVKRAIRGRATLIVNGSVDVAVALNADGLHLPENGIPVREARRAVGPNKLIGRSIHSVAVAAQAESDGADFLIAGTIYSTASHPNQPAQGVDFLYTLHRHVSLPVLAIGGVTAQNVGDIMATGVSGAAVITAISESQDPGLAARELFDKMLGAITT